MRLSVSPSSERTICLEKLTLFKDIVDPFDYETRPADRALLTLEDCFIEAATRSIVSNAFTKGRHENISI